MLNRPWLRGILHVRGLTLRFLDVQQWYRHMVVQKDKEEIQISSDMQQVHSAHSTRKGWLPWPRRHCQTPFDSNQERSHARLDGRVPDSLFEFSLLRISLKAQGGKLDSFYGTNTTLDSNAIVHCIALNRRVGRFGCPSCCSDSIAEGLRILGAAAPAFAAIEYLFL